MSGLCIKKAMKKRTDTCFNRDIHFYFIKKEHIMHKNITNSDKIAITSIITVRTKRLQQLVISSRNFIHIIDSI